MVQSLKAQEINMLPIILVYLIYACSLWFICSQSKREFLKKRDSSQRLSRLWKESMRGNCLEFFAVRLETKLSQRINLLNQQDIEV